MLSQHSPGFLGWLALQSHTFGECLLLSRLAKDNPAGGRPVKSPNLSERDVEVNHLKSRIRVFFHGVSRPV